MQEMVKLKFIRSLSRTISTCNTNFKSYAAREAKFMNRIMKGDQGKRKWFPNVEKASLSGEGSGRVSVPQNNRRNVVLNKLFMKYITDLLATGEVAPQVLNKGIEVSRVSVTADFKCVNVFWLAMDSGDADKLAEEALNKAAGPLRHELSQLRIMGVVPMIKFVRDKQYIREIEIDRRLAIADFGDDFVPTDPTLRLKSTPVLNLKLPSEVWSSIEKLELETPEPKPEIVEEALPEMRNDLYGLDQARIMATVKSSMDKSKAAYQQRSLNIVSPLPKVNDQSSTVAEYLSTKQKTAVFTAFLSKRELEAKRRRKAEMKLYREEELCSFDKKNDVNYDDNEEILDVDYHAEKLQQR